VYDTHNKLNYYKKCRKFRRTFSDVPPLNMTIYNYVNGVRPTVSVYGKKTCKTRQVRKLELDWRFL
jgi:hypothetical protein